MVWSKRGWKGRMDKVERLIRKPTVPVQEKDCGDLGCNNGWIIALFRSGT